MARVHTALVAILVEAGLPAATAKHFERAIDRGRYGGIGGDDLADLLLRWSHDRHMQRSAKVTAYVPPVAYHDADGQIILFGAREPSR